MTTSEPGISRPARRQQGLRALGAAACRRSVNQREQVGRLDGLDYMQQAARRLRAKPMLVIRVRRNGDDAYVAQRRIGSNAAADFEAVEAWQPEIEQHYIRPKCPCDIYRRIPVDREFDVVPLRLQQARERLDGVEIVFNDQNPARHRSNIVRITTARCRETRRRAVARFLQFPSKSLVGDAGCGICHAKIVRRVPHVDLHGVREVVAVAIR